MELLTSFPSIVQHYAPHFSPYFSEAGYLHFQKAISGFLISDNKTLEGMNRMFLAEARNQSSFNRFFHRQNYDLSKVNEARISMLQELPATRFKDGKRGGVLSVDDTLLKHVGRHFDHIYNLWDYTKNCYSMAHDLITLYYSDAETDYPLFYQLWLPPDWEKVARYLMDVGFTINQGHWDQRVNHPKKWHNYMKDRYRRGLKKHPEVAKVYQTKTHIAQVLIQQFCDQHPEKKYPIALDIGFTSASLCEFISEEVHRDYVGGIRNNRILLLKGGKQMEVKDFAAHLKAEHEDSSKPAVFKKVNFTYKHKTYTRYAYVANHRIRGFKKKQRLVISFSKEDLSSEPIYTITNRLNWYPSGILRVRRHRWPVETYHQEGKAQGLEAYQVRKFPAIETYLNLLVVAYSMLKCSVHDDALLSSIQQRLQTETTGSLPFLRRLMKAEGLCLLLEYVHQSMQQGQSFEQIWETFLPHLIYT